MVLQINRCIITNKNISAKLKRKSFAHRPFATFVINITIHIFQMTKYSSFESINCSVANSSIITTINDNWLWDLYKKRRIRIDEWES